MNRYRAARADTLRIVPLDLLTLIYHRASGITHVVEPPVPEILAMLDGQAMSVRDLLARLSSEYDMPDADVSALAMRLDELVGAGLVERL